MELIRNHFRKVNSGIFILIVIGTSLFFVSEFHRNWKSLQSASLQIHFSGILLAFSLIMLSYVLMTIAWHVGISAFPAKWKTTIAESFAIVNTTQLTKYIPGKVWSYALQMYLLASKGVPKSYVVYINLVTSLSGVLMNFLCAPFLLLFCAKRFPYPVVLLVLFVCIAGYSSFVFFNGNMVAYCVGITNRLFQRKMVFYKLSLSTVLKIQVLVFGVNFAFAGAGCAAFYGAGFTLSGSNLALVSIGVLLADSIGFIILISPAGIGIREGIMYAVLYGVVDKNSALVLPIVLRVLSMSSDLVLGTLAYFLYHSFKIKEKTGSSDHQDF